MARNQHRMQLGPMTAVQVSTTSRHINHTRRMCIFPQSIKLSSHPRHSGTPCSQDGLENSLTSTKKHPIKIPQPKKSSIACLSWRKRRPLRRNTLSTDRNLEESEVCREKYPRCCDSRVGPEKHGLVQRFEVAATQARSRRDEQNPHQRESTTQTNDEPEWLCCGVVALFFSTTHQPELQTDDQRPFCLPGSTSLRFHHKERRH